MSNVDAATNNKLNKLFMRIPKRSESEDRVTLVHTFVDLDPLFTLISVRDHQVIYGRRGTGKTHALLFKSESSSKQGALAIYVDMRTIGSSGGLYADTSVPLAERGTRLLIDTRAIASHLP